MYSLAHQYFVPEKMTAGRPGEIMLGKPFERARVRVFNTKLEVVSYRLYIAPCIFFTRVSPLQTSKARPICSVDSYNNRTCSMPVLNVGDGRQKSETTSERYLQCGITSSAVRPVHI